MIIIKEKNLKIQVLRAIAILAVVLIHTSPVGISQVFIRPLINFAVPTFLFISGYLTTIENSNWKLFCRKRIIRVIIPYIIWTFIYTSINFIGKNFEPKKYITHLLTAKGSVTLYYIFVYIQFVIFTPILGKLAKSKYKYLGFIISPLSVLIEYYWFLSKSDPNKLISTLYNICSLCWFNYYYLGLLLGNKIIQKQFNIKKLLFIYTIAIIIQMLESFWWFKLGETTNGGSQIKLSACLTSCIFILIAYWYINNVNITKTNKYLVLIGDYSFGIYLSHLLFILLLKHFTFYSKIPFGLNTLLILFLTISFIFLIDKFCGKKISKWLGMF